jgi:hypothetical protein
MLAPVLLGPPHARVPRFRFHARVALARGPGAARCLAPRASASVVSRLVAGVTDGRDRPMSHVVSKEKNHAPNTQVP